MPEIEITRTMPGYQCRHCGHRWVMRKPAPPARCPHCAKLRP